MFLTFSDQHTGDGSYLALSSANILISGSIWYAQQNPDAVSTLILHPYASLFLSCWVALSTSWFWTCTTTMSQVGRLWIWRRTKYLRVIELVIPWLKHLEIYLSWLTVRSCPVQVTWVILIALTTGEVYFFVRLSVPKLILDVNVNGLATSILVFDICKI